MTYSNRPTEIIEGQASVVCGRLRPFWQSLLIGATNIAGPSCQYWDLCSAYDLASSSSGLGPDFAPLRDRKVLKDACRETFLDWILGRIGWARFHRFGWKGYHSAYRRMTSCVQMPRYPSSKQSYRKIARAAPDDHHDWQQPPSPPWSASNYRRFLTHLSLAYLPVGSDTCQPSNREYQNCWYWLDSLEC